MQTTTAVVVNALQRPQLNILQQVEPHADGSRLCDRQSGNVFGSFAVYRIKAAPTGIQLGTALLSVLVSNETLSGPIQGGFHLNERESRGIIFLK